MEARFTTTPPPITSTKPLPMSRDAAFNYYLKKNMSVIAPETSRFIANDLPKDVSEIVGEIGPKALQETNGQAGGRLLIHYSPNCIGKWRDRSISKILIFLQIASIFITLTPHLLILKQLFP